MKYNNNKILFIKGENYHIPNDAIVKVIKYDEKIIIKNSWRVCNNLKNYKRVSKNTYINNETGEIIKYTINRLKSKSSLIKNMKKLKELIICNFKKEDNTLFLTLTSKNKVVDLKEIRKCTQNFIRRLKYNNSNYNFLYIYKFERGNNLDGYHVHMLLRDYNNKNIWLNNNNISKWWKYGFTYTEKVYIQGLTKTKGNFNEENEMQFKIVDYMCKITQLYDIPNNEKLYGTSKNIKKPIITKSTYQEVNNNILSNCELIKEDTLLLKDVESGYIINKHKYEIYKNNGND